MSAEFREPASSPDSMSKPKPRVGRSPWQTYQVGIQNRRREYLAQHPQYFTKTEHELADPLLYHSLIRRFQTSAERQAESKSKGYGLVLEASILRSEARLEQLAESDKVAEGGADQKETVDPDKMADDSEPEKVADEDMTDPGPATGKTEAQTPPPDQQTGQGGDHDGSNRGIEANGGNTSAAAAAAWANLPDDLQDRDEARQQWEDFLRDRFVRGEDEDFDYGTVDWNEDYDVQARADAEEAWFDDEEPAWVADADVDDGEPGSVDDGGGRGTADGKTARPEGETGIQDY